MQSSITKKSPARRIASAITVRLLGLTSLWLRLLGSTAPASEVRAEEILHQFYARCLKLPNPRVLELGTARSQPDRSTRHEHWVPNASEYLGTDIEAGVDVDLVADVHRLTQVTGTEAFDVIISCSTFEHFKYPHLAAHEIMKALRVGGLLFIQTHQAFPVHAYPYDYFRFSKEALAGLFGGRMGFEVLATGYDYPARVFGVRGLGATDSRVAAGPAFLNVVLFGEKRSRTPEEFVYEYDAL